MNLEQFQIMIKKLFKPGEFIAIGDEHSYKVLAYDDCLCLQTLPPLLSINPVHGSHDYKDNKPGARRADLNVVAFRSFLFEMDFMPLNAQISLIERLPIKPTLVTYSGGKSYHCLYTLISDLLLVPHLQDSIDSYKNQWKALQVMLDGFVKEQGIALPANKDSFFDPACKNPSRYSRVSGSLRNGETLQELVQVGKFMFIDQLPTAKSAVRTAYKKPATNITGDNIRFYLPAELKVMLDTPSTWGAAEGLYPLLLRLALWAIDSTGVNYETLITYMSRKTFPGLLRMGYPQHKLTKAIEDAFRMKGEL